MQPVLLNTELARRIEHAEARAGAAAAEGLALARPASGSAVQRIAGGYAIYLGQQTSHLVAGKDDSRPAELLAKLVCEEDFAQVKACEGPRCTLLFADFRLL